MYWNLEDDIFLLCSGPVINSEFFWIKSMKHFYSDVFILKLSNINRIFLVPSLKTFSDPHEFIYQTDCKYNFENSHNSNIVKFNVKQLQNIDCQCLNEKSKKFHLFNSFFFAREIFIKKETFVCIKWCYKQNLKFE